VWRTCNCIRANVFVMCGDLRSNTISAAAWLYRLLFRRVLGAR
jgi:hypothetical protein